MMPVFLRKILYLQLFLLILSGVASPVAAQTPAERPAVRNIGRATLGPAMRFLKGHKSALRQAVQENGGPIEVHREGPWRLLVTEAGKLAYQRVDQEGSRVQKVTVRMLFPHGKFPRLDDDVLLDRLRKRLEVKAQTADRSPPAEATPHAILPDGQQVPPSSFRGGYHGTLLVAPEVALKDGLPGRGTDLRLKQHAEEAGDSAFRGVTEVISDPVTENGAAYWAGKGGWVYDIRGVAGWDINELLEGRVKTPGGYRGNLMSGEQETAILARVPPEKIKAYGVVEEDSRGRLLVRTWIPNPGYKGP